MAYSPPTFNLTCDLWTVGTWPGGTARETAVPCQWRTVAKLTSANYLYAGGLPFLLTEILFPKGTDVRFNRDDLGTVTDADTIVLAVDGGELTFETVSCYDVGKGFSNEYRIALTKPLYPWPIPTP